MRRFPAILKMWDLRFASGKSKPIAINLPFKGMFYTFYTMKMVILGILYSEGFTTISQGKTFLYISIDFCNICFMNSSKIKPQFELFTLFPSSKKNGKPRFFIPAAPSSPNLTGSKGPRSNMRTLRIDLR